MARPRKRRRRRSRGGGRFLSLYLVLAVVVTAVVIGAGCIVFFKVNQFEVEGNQRYSTEEIAKASGVSKGDNLFLVNKTETARKLLDELAYVRSVNIKRKLPDTRLVSVDYDASTGDYYDSDGDRYYLDENGNRVYY